MDWPRLVGTALVVGIIAPLFWLGVKVLETLIHKSISRLRERFRRR